MNKRIAIVADNSTSYIEKLFKIWEEKNCAVLIDYKIPWNQVKEMLNIADASSCYIDEKLKHNYNDLNIPYEIIKRDKTIKKVIISPKLDFFNNYSDEDALVLFSSGTTGKAKAVVLSFAAIQSNSDSIKEYMKLTKKDNLFIVKSLVHSSTIVGELLAGIKSEANMFITSTVYSIKGLIDSVNKNHISVICLNPTLLSLISNYMENHDSNINTVKVIYTSGSILSKEFHSKLKKQFAMTQILNVYGLTECGPRVSAQTPDRTNWSSGSTGKILKNVKIEIRDSNNKPATIGVIWIKTNSIFTKYLIEEKYLDERGFFCSNDIGYIEDNELFVIGRYDNVIISGAHNIYPEQIETVINSFNEIDDCVVLGQKDELYVNKIVCLYVAKNECSNDIRKYCRDYLANYEMPHTFIRIKKVYRNQNGKIIRTLKIDEYEKVI